MPNHFEDVWEQAENFHKEAKSGTTPTDILNELILKIELYKTVEANTEQLKEEATNIKSRLFGEILLTLTNLSLLDNINTFEALILALQQRSVDYFNKKYPL
jgi:hypothetical protein